MMVAGEGKFDTSGQQIFDPFPLVVPSGHNGGLFLAIESL
jgi:hypothetical protein